MPDTLGPKTFFEIKLERLTQLPSQSAHTIQLLKTQVGLSLWKNRVQKIGSGLEKKVGLLHHGPWPEKIGLMQPYIF